MPIVNCIVAPECQQSEHSLVDLWASESGHSPDHMTVNIIAGTHQLGNQYSVMATLFLPSIWSDTSVSSLQIGLAEALAKYYNLSLDEIHIITNIVKSGLVVESGQEQKW